MNDPSTGQRWWNETAAGPATGAATQYLRTSYFFGVSDLGNYSKLSSTGKALNTSVPVERYNLASSMSPSTRFEGFSTYRKKYALLRSTMEFAQDLVIMDASAGNVVYGNHAAGGGGTAQAARISGTEAQPGYVIAPDKSGLVGANCVYADGSVQAMSMNDLTRVYCANIFVNSPGSSMFVGMPPNTNPLAD